MKASGEGYKSGPVQAEAPAKRNSLKDLINSDYVKQRFTEVMGERAPAFLASVLSAVATNPALSKCDTQSVLSSAMVAATLDLPINPSLGFSAIVPYKTKGRLVAQFQIMTKGFVQLALRSGQYKTLNVSPIYEDEFKGYDIITGDVFIEPVEDGYRAHDEQNKIVGYAAFFRLLNGFERIEYWPLKKIIAHGKRFSKSFDQEYGLWKTDPHAMYSKTVLKMMLSKWGILSVSMQIAMKTDQAAIRDFSRPVDDEANVEYVDSTDDSQSESGENTQSEPSTPERPALPAEHSAEAPPPVAAPRKTPEPVAASASSAQPPAESYEPSGPAEGDEEPGLF